jgi:hypothetical protein
MKVAELEAWAPKAISSISDSPNPSKNMTTTRECAEQLQVWRAFEADIAAPTLRLVIDRTQHVGCRTDIGDSQILIDFGYAVAGLGGLALL